MCICAQFLLYTSMDIQFQFRYGFWNEESILSI